MKKDAYYFPHFCNARSDRKIKRLIKDLGIEGYGIYFMILETLREQTDYKYPLSDVDLLADEFGTSEAKLLAAINTYDLFDIDRENNFFSPKMILYMQPYIEKSNRARLAAKKRWDNVQKNANAYANALPEHCESESKCNANQNASKGEEKKGEESKEKDTITDYKSLYDYYLTLNLIKHKNYTDAMRNAIKKAIKECKYTIEDCKVLLKRHSEVVELTKKSEYKVKVRGLDSFFGQKVSGGVNLICSEYEEGGSKYETHLRNKKKSEYIPVEGNVIYVDKEPTEDEEVVPVQEEIPF